MGKSGLGLVLAGRKFRATESTHGRHIWTMDKAEVSALWGGLPTAPPTGPKVSNDRDTSAKTTDTPTAGLRTTVDERQKDGRFDLFLCHNSADKPAVREFEIGRVAVGNDRDLDQSPMQQVGREVFNPPTVSRTSNCTIPGCRKEHFSTSKQAATASSASS